MIQKLFLLLLFLLVFGELFSQSDIRKGFIINNENDTIYGLIDYKDEILNSGTCVFKQEKDTEFQKLSPLDIKAYRFINGNYYVSKPFNSGENVNFFFLEYLIDGVVDIYFYRDGSGDYHFFVENCDSILYELKNDKEIAVYNGTKYIRYTKEYMGVLKYVYKESPTIIKELENINLTQKDLIKTGREFHREIYPDKNFIIYEKSLPKIVVKFGPLLGIKFTNVSIGDSYSDYNYFLYKSKFDLEINPLFGIYFKFNMPQLHERLFFQYEFSYSKSNLHTINTYYFETMKHINELSLSQNAFNNGGILRYEIPGGKVRPTFQIGGFVNYYFDAQYERKLEIRYIDTDITYAKRETHENPFSNIEYGLSTGFGLIRKMNNQKEIFLDIRYQYGMGLKDYFCTNNILINLGIQIGE